MKKVSKILVVIAIVLILTTDVFASSVYVEEIEGEGTTVTINKGELNDKITKIDKTNNEVEIELNVKAEELKEIRDNTEIVFVIDNSGSMSTKVNGTNATRKNNVVNSTKTLIEKIHDKNENIKMGIVCFANAATTLVDLTNDKDRLISNLTSFGEKTTTGETAMSRGLKLAKSKFSADANNKILILLTDGMPTDDYQTVRSDLQDDSIYIISTLVGLENASKNEKTVISVLFGTEEQPVPDRLYNITDNQVEETISNDIYEKVIEGFKETIKDITIENEIPDEILNNFDIKLEDETTGCIEDNKIIWKIPELQSLENESLKYTLTLKEDFDENIINKVLDTSKNIQIEYNDIENNRKLEVMESVPQIMIKQDEEEIEEPMQEEPEQEEVEEVEEQQEEPEQEKVEEQQEQQEEQEQEEIKEIEEKQEERIKIEEKQEERIQIEEKQEERIKEEIREIQKKEIEKEKQIEKEIIQIEESKVEEPKEENTNIELKEIENEAQIEQVEENGEEKIELTTEQIEEQEESKMVEKVEEKTIQADNTVANKELAYTGTSKTLIISIIITSIFAIYEGIKLIKPIR